MGVLSVVSVDPSQVDRPSVLPPPNRVRGGADRRRAIEGVEPGRPVPKKLLRGRPDPTKLCILRPVNQATMDFLPARRDIHIDDHGRVTHVTCG